MSAVENEVFGLQNQDKADSNLQPLHGIVVGTLVGFDGDQQPLVIHKARAHNATAAASILDLHGAHIGRHVVLQFEAGNIERPIVMGVLRNKEGWPLEGKPAQVEVDVDGQRMVVSAKEQLVLKCGKASVTLTKAGKVIIQGTYVSNRSSGVMRIKGGSVQLN